MLLQTVPFSLRFTFLSSLSQGNTKKTWKAKKNLTDLLSNTINIYAVMVLLEMLNITYNHIIRSRVVYLNIWAKIKISRVLRPSSVRRLSSRRKESLLNSSPEHPSCNHYWVIVENHWLEKPSLEDSLESLLNSSKNDIKHWTCQWKHKSKITN